MRATGWGSGSLETGEPPPATVDCVSCVEFARTLKYSLNSIKRSMAASRSDFPADSRRAVGHAHQATPMLTLFFSFFFYLLKRHFLERFICSQYMYIFFLVYDAFKSRFNGSLFERKLLFTFRFCTFCHRLEGREGKLLNKYFTLSSF